MQSETNIFILGLGTQKAGTTWLARELRACNVVFPFGKEAHVWDSIEEHRHQNEEIPCLDSKNKTKANRVRRSVNTPSEYFEICRNINKSRNLPIADITPNYCCLKKETLQHIKDQLTENKFKVRALFLARDPFSRIWSMQRMGIKIKERKGEKNIDNLLKPSNMHQQLLSNHFKDYQRKRTQYEEIIPKLSAVFSAEELKIFFYENLFTQATYNEICNHAELAPGAPNFTQIDNQSPTIKAPPQETKQAIISSYKATYTYMHKHFPITSKLWRSSLELLKQ